MPKILMIEDEEDLVRFFGEALRSYQGVQFLGYSKGAEGLAAARREKPDFILMDLRMPGFNGEQALKELKELLPETKFAIMTGWDDEVTRGRIEREIGVDAYFEKPVDFENVLNRIAELAGIHL